MTKNGELVAAAESNVLQVNTDTLMGTPFGEYICIVNNSVIAVEKAVTVKEKRKWVTLSVSNKADSTELL